VLALIFRHQTSVKFSDRVADHARISKVHVDHFGQTLRPRSGNDARLKNK
jgi:hypothetical protein